MPATGGPWVRLTRDGSESLFESADGGWIYYVNREGKLAKAESSGSLQEEVVGTVPGLRVLFPMWDMSKSGLYFFNSSSFPVRIERFEFATGLIRPVLDLGTHLHDAGLTVSPDEAWVLYTRVDYLNSDIRLMEEFR